MEQAGDATDHAGSSVRGLMAGAAGAVPHQGNRVDRRPIRADDGSGIKESGGSTAATYGSGVADNRAAAAGRRDGLPGGPTEVASGAAAGDVAVPGPASAAATPNCKDVHNRGATAEDGTAPAGGDGPAADESDGRPFHHRSNLAQGPGPAPSAPVNLPAPCSAGRGGGSPSWPRWTRGSGLPHLSRGHVPDVAPDLPAHTDVAAMRMTVAAEAVYDSVDDLSRALYVQQATFTPWRRDVPAFKPVVAGSIWTPSGPRRVSILLDTGATHCFVCAQLVALLQLPPGSSSGPAAVSMASPDTTRALPPPVGVHLALGADGTLRELIDMSPLDLGPGLDIILGWDWISSHDLRFLYPIGTVADSGQTGVLGASLQPASLPASTAAQTLISHGELRRMLRQLVATDDSATTEHPPPASPPPPTHHSGLSKPSEPLGAAEVARLDAAAQARRDRWRRRRCGPDPPPARFASGVEYLADGTELHLASLRIVDSSLELQGADHPAFSKLKSEYADVLGGPPPGLPPDRGIELVLETGARPMPRTRPIKRLSEG